MKDNLILNGVFGCKHLGQDQIVELMSLQDKILFDIDGDRVTDQDTFFEAAAKGLGFPSYFGRNWNAFEECIRDLSWCGENQGYIVIFRNSEKFLQANPRTFCLMIDIFRSTVEDWNRRNRTFLVLLELPPSDFPCP